MKDFYLFYFVTHPEEIFGSLNTEIAVNFAGFIAEISGVTETLHPLPYRMPERDYGKPYQTSEENLTGSDN